MIDLAFIVAAAWMADPGFRAVSHACVFLKSRLGRRWTRR